MIIIHFADWANKMLWSSGAWLISYSESIFNSVNSSIYCFFAYGSTRYVHLASFSVNDGSIISSVYRSSKICTNVWSSAINGDFIIATIQWPSSPFYLLMMRITTFEFSIKEYSYGLFGLSIEIVSGR